MINAGEVEKALIGKLSADAELIGYLSDGIYYDLARQGATRFGIVSLSTSRGLYELNDGETFRAFTYVVKAVVLGNGNDPVAKADARIQALIDRQPLALPPESGASLMVARWVDRVRYTETANNEFWQHRGGRYEITVTPA